MGFLFLWVFELQSIARARVKQIMCFRGELQSSYSSKPALNAINAGFNWGVFTAFFREWSVLKGKIICALD